MISAAAKHATTVSCCAADTFEAVQTWLKEVREYSDAGVVCTLVGNKSDLSNIRAVQQNEAKVIMPGPKCM